MDRMERKPSCCFTGHRPNKLPWGGNEQDPRCLRLKERIRAELLQAYDDGYRHFICGMARGADLYFCEAVLALRDERPGITVEAAVPCEDQARHWPQSEYRRYCELLGHCDYETMVQRRYDPGCMHRRNRYMADHASRLIAVFDGSSGGTLYTVNYAMRRGLEVIILSVESDWRNRIPPGPAACDNEE